MEGSGGLDQLIVELKDIVRSVAAQGESLFGNFSNVEFHCGKNSAKYARDATRGTMQPKLPRRDLRLDEIEPEFLLKAYQLGVFPMAMQDGEIAWFSPDPRGVIPLDAFHIPHGLRRALKREPFEVRVNTRFREVMLGCADRRSTWIDESILLSYGRLYEMGYAHSVETWAGDELVGGLYGVVLGGAFFGESMFSRATDASKVALVYLVNRLNERGFKLLDTQWSTPHLRQFGCVDIPRFRYLRLLDQALRMKAKFLD